MKKRPTLKSLKKKAWKLFSEYVRRRDADEGGTVRCYTCGMLLFWKDSQCGHAIGGRHHAVLFDADICRNQCVRCNVFMRGNYPVFAAKLISERGLSWFEQKLDGSRRLLKYTHEDLETLIADLKEKLKELELEPA